MPDEPMNSEHFKRATAILALLLCSFAGGTAVAQKVTTVAGPNGRLKVDFRLDAAGSPRYAIRLDDKPVLLDSRLGLVRDDADFSKGLRLLSESRVEAVRDRYEILTAKRRVNLYRANRRVFRLATASGQRMEIIFQVSDDGVAFRYHLPGPGGEVRRMNEEVSSFHLPPGAREATSRSGARPSGSAPT
jgi:alpha-glucosidase